MTILLVFAFVSGLFTILAPCIWPLLPIVLSSSLGGKDHRRPLGITLGITLSFAIFTLTISYLVSLLDIDPNVFRLFAVVVIGFLGLMMIVPALSQWVEASVSKLSGMFGSSGSPRKNGFWGGFITGLSLGIVWAPCAGPILATIATLAATEQVSFKVILVTLSYVLGVGIPLFAFAYGGQQLFTKTRFLSPHTGKIQQLFGIIMILTAISIYTNYDKVIQVKLLEAFPQFSEQLTKFESNPEIKEQLDVLKGNKPNKGANPTANTSDLFNTDAPAPEIVGITKWLNLPAGRQVLTLKDLRGKVVLVDFWTYTCINCIRTLPFVTNWYDKYKNKGFVVIGVHTPEFAFEKNTDNVLNAIKQYKIHYPVAQDNNYATWNNYDNHYWPAHYLIDAQGTIRRIHYGEGEYDQTEKAIQELLKEAGNTVTNPLADMPDQTPTLRFSPETYLGAERMEYYNQGGNTGIVQQTFTLNENPNKDRFSLGGKWNITDENAVSEKNATLAYRFFADRVFLVLRPGEAKQGKVQVLLDGKPVTAQNAGADVKNGTITVDQDRLYNLIDLQGKPGEHTLKLIFQTPGVEAFAFTFG